MRMKNFWKFLSNRVDLFVLVVCLTITFAIWGLGSKYDRSNLNLLEQVNHEVIVNLSEEVDNTFAFIDGVRGLYVASENVTDEKLSDYMKVASQNHLSASVLRVNIVTKIPNNKLKEVKIEKNYNHQFLVTQVVNKNGEVDKLKNINLLNDENEQKLIDEIISGENKAMIAVPNLKNIGEYDGTGFIFMVPIFKHEEMVGMVEAQVSDREMISVLKRMIPPDWDWSWYLDDNLIAEQKKIQHQLLDSVSGQINITNNSKWSISMSKVKLVHPMWNIFFGIGIVVSFVIFIVVYALSSANTRGMGMARRMTLDLQKFKLALDSASNHIVITDADGIVLYANKAAEILTGFSSIEIIGKTPRLWGGKMPKDFYVTFWKKIKDEKQVFSGIFNNKRKNGEDYLAQATVSPILDEKKNLVGFVGVEVDVTKERKIQEENNSYIQKLAKFNELMVGRELKMVELKKTISELKEKYEK